MFCQSKRLLDRTRDIISVDCRGGGCVHACIKIDAGVQRAAGGDNCKHSVVLRAEQRAGCGVMIAALWGGGGGVQAGGVVVAGKAVKAPQRAGTEGVAELKDIMRCKRARTKLRSCGEH